MTVARFSVEESLSWVFTNSFVGLGEAHKRDGTAMPAVMLTFLVSWTELVVNVTRAKTALQTRTKGVCSISSAVQEALQTLAFPLACLWCCNCRLRGRGRTIHPVSKKVLATKASICAAGNIVRYSRVLSRRSTDGDLKLWRYDQLAAHAYCQLACV